MQSNVFGSTPLQWSGFRLNQTKRLSSSYWKASQADSDPLVSFLSKQVKSRANEDNLKLSNLEPIICDILALSPTNAVVESVFSEIKHFWTYAKSNIHFLAIYSFIMIRLNLDMSIEEFYELVKKDTDLIGLVGKMDKYNEMKNLKEAQQNIPRDFKNLNAKIRFDDADLQCELVVDNEFMNDFWFALIFNLNKGFCPFALSANLNVL